jgi:AraC-like DNA-binding protein
MNAALPATSLAATSLAGISPAFRKFHFTDIDEFRRATRKLRVDFTPLARKISVQQAILNLAGVDIVVVNSFPRIADIQVAPDCSAVCFSMDDNDLIRFNGIDVDRAMIGIGHGGNGFSIVERTGARLASIFFTPEIHDRGWPESHRHFQIFLTDVSAQQKLRLIVSEILKFASVSLETLVQEAAMAGIRESLLATVDEAFESANFSNHPRSLHAARAFAIYQKIEAALLDELKGPVYSTALASAVGVSVRTLHDVIMQHRGISLHRYLKLKRLWMVRLRLLAGGVSVKACALECGFWHLSDFSRAYRLHFGETPSQTLANTRMTAMSRGSL